MFTRVTIRGVGFTVDYQRHRQTRVSAFGSFCRSTPAAQAYDVISGRTIQLDTDSLQLGVRDVLVLDFQQADNQYHK